MMSKEWMDPNIKKPAPWPYKTKKYTYLKSFWEGTVKRFDENTKVVVVDGTIGAGKNEFAKELADAFDMIYFPEPTLDRWYITPYGYDLRKIDPIVPPSYKSCDISTFYKNPHDMNVPKFQFKMFMLRYLDYIHALTHVLNTGQGVVMERSVYSDFVFIEAMHEHGYITNEARDLYYTVTKNTLEELLRPHLIIYLDVSPEVAMERIKKKNDPIEVNSPALTMSYLESIERYYKQHYLKEFEKHSEIVIYDWSNYGDVEVVVEDIERIDFERYTKYDNKLADWRKADDWEWGWCRRRYANDRELLLRYAYIFRPKVTELFHPAEESVEYQEILKKVPGELYADGFNPSCGDNVWFKWYHKGYWYTYLERMPY